MSDNTGFTLADVTAGQSWGCRYRVTRMLDQQGNPVKNLQVGQSAAGPGVVEGIGVIKTRDVANQRLELVDIVTKEVFVVAFDNVWDINHVVVDDSDTPS